MLGGARVLWVAGTVSGPPAAAKPAKPTRRGIEAMGKDEEAEFCRAQARECIASLRLPQQPETRRAWQIVAAYWEAEAALCQLRDITYH